MRLSPHEHLKAAEQVHRQARRRSQRHVGSHRSTPERIGMRFVAHKTALKGRCASRFALNALFKQHALSSRSGHGASRVKRRHGKHPVIDQLLKRGRGQRAGKRQRAGIAEARRCLARHHSGNIGPFLCTGIGFIKAAEQQRCRIQRRIAERAIRCRIKPGPCQLNSRTWRIERFHGHSDIA